MMKSTCHAHIVSAAILVALLSTAACAAEVNHSGT